MNYDDVKMKQHIRRNLNVIDVMRTEKGTSKEDSTRYKVNMSEGRDDPPTRGRSTGPPSHSAAPITTLTWKDKNNINTSLESKETVMICMFI